MKLIPWNLGLALTFLLVPLVPAWGDEDQEEADHHREHGLIEEIVVHGHLLGGGERAQNVTILGEEDVARGRLETPLAKRLAARSACTRLRSGLRWVDWLSMALVKQGFW